MSDYRFIPVDFVVERAKAKECAEEALPLRTLIADWLAFTHCEFEGHGALRDIDSHFHTAQEIALEGAQQVVLPGCVLGRFRTNALAAKKLVEIIHDIHRRMNIPLAQSRKAKRPEDVRQDSWTWPHVMRIMLRKGIINDNTNKATFGALIEQILGDKVKPNSIRRANYGNYDIVSTYDYDLSEQDKDIIKEITALFWPLLKSEN